MTLSLLLAVMVHERPPLRLDDLPAMLAAWLQDAGGFAALGLAVWGLAYFLNPSIAAAEQPWPGWKKKLFLLLTATTAFGYIFVGILYATASKPPPPETLDRILSLVGAIALVTVAVPFAWDMIEVRLRRIGALAWLSFWEAIRNRVLVVLLLLAPVFFFGDWFMTQQPRNQLRTAVEVEYIGMTVLLLFTAVILAAFGIPNDIRHQSIYTVIVKPVQRFEIVAGRFLGYTALMTLMLAVLTVAGLLYVAIPGRISEAAKRDTWRARVPIYGELDFRGPVPGKATVKTAREWEYRRYIPGGTGAEAVWSIYEMPGQLAERQSVPCEFEFDIFRVRRGEEGHGVRCLMKFATWRWSPGRKVEYDRELDRARASGASLPEVYDRLAEKYGFFQYRREVFDHQSFVVDVPAGLFKNAQGSDPARQAELQSLGQLNGQKPPPPVEVSVVCEQPTQFLGMARHDLYFVDAEGWFPINFLKGAIGIWFRLCIIIGLAVACSTYLSGVISLICALCLYAGGLGREFIENVAAGKVEGGGPMEQMLRIVKRMNLTAPMDASPTATTATGFDRAFEWLMRRVLNIVPDVDRFDLSRYVSEGFDISSTTLLLCAIVLVGYLLPWAVLAHYLLKSREVAG